MVFMLLFIIANIANSAICISHSAKLRYRYRNDISPSPTPYSINCFKKRDGLAQLASHLLSACCYESDIKLNFHTRSLQDNSKPQQPSLQPKVTVASTRPLTPNTTISDKVRTIISGVNPPNAQQRQVNRVTGIKKTIATKTTMPSGQVGHVSVTPL